MTRSRSFLHIAILLGVWGSTAFAQPAPAGTQSLLDADQALSRAVAAQGMREPFVATLVSYGMLFQPHPVDGIAWLKEHPVEAGTLSWTPERVELAGSGELGYVLSKWTLEKKGAVARAGHHLQIWKWWPNAGWRLLARIATDDDAPVDSLRSLRTDKHSIMPHSHAAGERQVLQEADRDLAAVAAKDGFGAAFGARAADDIVVLRQAQAPARGAAAARTWAESVVGKWSYDSRLARVADSGDLGYTFGRAALHTGAAGPDSVQSFSYVRVWRKPETGPPSIAVEALLPIPPD